MKARAARRVKARAPTPHSVNPLKRPRAAKARIEERPIPVKDESAPGLLVRYDAMCHAIDAAFAVDEVKDIRAKAIALELYSRQALNKDAVRKCGVIRLRAERKAGELLSEMEKAKGAREPRTSRGGARSDAATASKLIDLGISKAQSSQWQAVARIPSNTFEAALAAVAIPTTHALVKKPMREQREAALAERTIAASRKLGTKLFSVIYADPPWRFEPYSRVTGMDRAADNHYPTMTLDAIKAMPIPAADDCVLFLWATAPMLPQALDVMAAWGFAYKSHCVWLKDRLGTGYWVRNKHELLLVGVKGSVPAPAPGDQPASVIEAPVGAHSTKPESFAEMIEVLFPNLPKVELFARNTRAGWDVFGNAGDALHLFARHGGKPQGARRRRAPIHPSLSREDRRMTTPYVSDIGIEERLLAVVPDDQGRHARLGPALRTAAAQLELLTPAVLQAGVPRGMLSAGRVAEVDHDCVVVVLAEGDRCITFYSPVETTVAAMVYALIAVATANAYDALSPGDVIRRTVEVHGAAAGATAAKVMPLINGTAVVGALLSAIPDHAALAAMVTMIRDHGVCPAIVGVVGASLSGHPASYAYCWPVVVPMGEYAELFEARAAAPAPL